MKIQTALKLITAYALIHWATASIAHEKSPHTAKTTAVVKEQKD